MRTIRTTLIALTLAAGGLVALAPNATAADDSATYTCSATRIARMTSDTSGLTRHTWTSASGDYKAFQWASGGVHTSYGFAGRNFWTLHASVIHSDSRTCVD